MNAVFDTLASYRNDAFGFFKQVFLFGSSLRTATPNDIDILLIYETPNLDRVNIKKKKTEEILGQIFPDLPLHFTVLSEEELEQSDFLSRVPHRAIKGASSSEVDICRERQFTQM